MISERTYLDYNATAPVRPAVIETMVAALGTLGNPSSVHAEGRKARALVETARESVAAMAGGRAKHVVFTSCGTEGANMLLRPGFAANGHAAERLLVLGTEHACCLDGHRFGPDAVAVIPVDGEGRADLAWLATELAAGGPALVAVQLVNNETGVVQPVRAIADMVHAAGGALVCDAVQAAGKLPMALAELGADALILSAHKIGGPQGVGAVVLAGDHVRIAGRLMRGGGQERNARAGTQNVAGIAGFGTAAALAVADLDRSVSHFRALRDGIEGEVRRIAPEAVVFGADAPRVANTSAFAIPGLSAETLLMHLDLRGIALSSGSACSSGKVSRSHVLLAMGVDKDLAGGVIRASVGWASVEADIARFAEAFEKTVETLHKGAKARRAA